MLEWTSFLEKKFPQAFGFGRLVDLDYSYWHRMQPSPEIQEKELLKRLGETLKVARMYSLHTDRVKFTSLGYSIYVVAPEKAALCLVLARHNSLETDFIWESLEEGYRLVPTED
ncbi:MAG TPA: hypothetical protein EYO33_06070 [Phycisphaerales bacterium]|nr:hypothetical protein [Phycisphaerales bacterium]